jgi:glycosyltransferase involved in cell wall biosynthesis
MRTAISKFLPQTNNYNIEVVIVDNNSSDNTKEVVSELAESYGQLRYNV